MDVVRRLLSHGYDRGVILDCPMGLTPIRLMTFVATFAIVRSWEFGREEVGKGAWQVVGMVVQSSRRRSFVAGRDRQPLAGVILH